MANPVKPTTATLKKLFAVSSNRCAFSGCTTPVIDVNKNVILAQVCHINAQSRLGRRYVASQTPKERHGFENLVLMCSVHHTTIDAPENESEYSEIRLKEIKADHERLARTTNTVLPSLTGELIAQLQTVSAKYENSVLMDFRGARFELGGKGGQMGGAGGNGGVLNIVGNTQPPDMAKVVSSGEDGVAFGAGGGGGGALRLEGRSATVTDTSAGLRVSSFFPADAVRHDGLFNVLGGGWAVYHVTSIPQQIVIPVICIVELGEVQSESLLRFDVEILNAKGVLVASAIQDVGVPIGIDLTPRRSFFKSIVVEIDAIGAWTIRLKSGSITFASYSFEVRLTRQPPA